MVALTWAVASLWIAAIVMVGVILAVGLYARYKFSTPSYDKRTQGCIDRAKARQSSRGGDPPWKRQQTLR